MTVATKAKPPVNLNTPAIADYADKLRGLSDRALAAEMRRNISGAAEGVARMAAVWTEFERRGMDVTPMRDAFGEWLGAVAAGRLLPEAVAKYMGRHPALSVLLQLSTTEQADVLRTGTIPVRTAAGADNVPIHTLTTAQIKRAIDPASGRVRPVSEQPLPNSVSRGPNKSTHTITTVLDYPDYQRLVTLASERNTTTHALVRSLIMDAVS